MRPDAPAGQREGCVVSSLRLRRLYRFCSLQLAVAQCLRPERPRQKAMPISQTGSSRPQSTCAQPNMGGSTCATTPDRAGRHAQPRKPPWKHPRITRAQQDAEGPRTRSRPSLRALQYARPPCRIGRTPVSVCGIPEASADRPARRVAGSERPGPPVRYSIGWRSWLLVNNAGSASRSPRRTANGFELGFATGHRYHFALTGLLLPRQLMARLRTQGLVAP